MADTVEVHDNQPQDNVIFGVMMAFVMLAILVTASIVTLRAHPFFDLGFATGGSCYVVGHQVASGCR